LHVVVILSFVPVQRPVVVWIRIGREWIAGGKRLFDRFVERSLSDAAFFLGRVLMSHDGNPLSRDLSASTKSDRVLLQRSPSGLLARRQA
jgi:hypothetical protein